VKKKISKAKKKRRRRRRRPPKRLPRLSPMRRIQRGRRDLPLSRRP